MKQPAPKPGIYPGVPFAEYEQWDALNPSLVKWASKSLRAFRHRMQHPVADTPAMRLGRAEHVAMLEPDSLPLRYAVWPGRRAGKKYQAFIEANAGREVLAEKDWARCCRMRDAARAHPMVGPYLAKPGQNEVSVVWIDRDTDQVCKGRFDRLTSDGEIVDLKTTAMLEDWALIRTIARLGYHLSLAAYQDALWHLLGTREPAPAKLLWVCTDDIADCVCMNLGDEPGRVARKRWRALLRDVAEARATNRWPGIAEDNELEIVLPSYEAEMSGLTLDGEGLED